MTITISFVGTVLFVLKICLFAMVLLLSFGIFVYPQDITWRNPRVQAWLAFNAVFAMFLFGLIHLRIV